MLQNGLIKLNELHFLSLKSRDNYRIEILIVLEQIEIFIDFAL